VAAVKILVTGDRKWRDAVLVFKVMQDLDPYINRLKLVHGDAAGADTIADVCGQLLGYEILRYPADWNQYGKSAGPIRNRQMLDENPDIDLVLAFHDDLDHSKGTQDMVTEAKRRGIQVEVRKHEGLPNL
jgi:hypothetical protein